MIETRQAVRITSRWPDAPSAREGLMLALHAHRSAAAIAAWAEAHPGRGLAVVLTGTDLYRDLRCQAEPRRSLELAQQLVVLQPLGLGELAPAHAAKARAIFQSCDAHPPVPKPAHRLRAVMVGHLRAVKSPGTLFEAARRLVDHPEILIDHIGEASEPAWAEQALRTQALCPQYRWHGALPHPQTRAAIAGAHVLVHTSALEGGAHVIMEAVRSATPVLASQVAGNVGMLGEDYAGYFPHGDAQALAQLLLRCRQAQQDAGGQSPAAAWMATLRAQCALRAPLFEPQAERTALFQLLDDLQDPP